MDRWLTPGAIRVDKLSANQVYRYRGSEPAGVSPLCLRKADAVPRRWHCTARVRVDFPAGSVRWHTGQRHRHKRHSRGPHRPQPRMCSANKPASASSAFTGFEANESMQCSSIKPFG